MTEIYILENIQSDNISYKIRREQRAVGLISSVRSDNVEYTHTLISVERCLKSKQKQI